MEKTPVFRNIGGFRNTVVISDKNTNFGTNSKLFNPPKVPPFLLRSLLSDISAVIRIALREHLLKAGAILASSSSVSGKNWLCHVTMLLVCWTLTSHCRHKRIWSERSGIGSGTDVAEVKLPLWCWWQGVASLYLGSEGAIIAVFF